MSTDTAAIAPDRETAPLWRSRNGKLLIQRCEDCREVFYYPRAVCPHCLSPRVSWLECSGRAKIYSYSVMRRGEPYAMAYVTLEEGPRIMTNIVDCDLDRIGIDQQVSVVWRDVNGSPTPMFRPVD